MSPLKRAVVERSNSARWRICGETSCKSSRWAAANQALQGQVIQLDGAQHIGVDQCAMVVALRGG